MIVTIIGSTEYKDRMERWAMDNCQNVDEIIMPHFDNEGTILSPLAICRANIENIKRADKVVIFWNSRSMGTWGDFMATLALEKPIEIVHQIPYEQSLPKAMQEYNDECNKGT